MAESEFALIERFFAAGKTERSDVVLGVGDDCALLVVPAGRQLAVSLDVLVADRHFFATADPQGIGHKALAVNLSDLAAMGAEPAWVTLGLTLPEADTRWLDGFCRGFFALARQYGVQLVGGDTTSGPLAIIAVQVHGFVEPGRALRRDGARPGDLICVTGTPGDAGLALSAARGEVEVSDPHAAYLRERMERPVPRIRPGRDLVGLASAAIDVSDGLAQDLGHILKRSGIGARLDADRLPASAALAAHLDGNARAHAILSGGDDYELCFTLPPERLVLLRERVAGWDCRCTEIGVIETEPGLRCRRGDGSLLRLEHAGHDHFAT
jgi:thiamine-monophosphate kinase